ncbi:MAG: hypothetical protein HYY67_08875 [Thaumarchaeota archaeon]|nr:hypothetical protein [Nitrososphaerota archaeon]
MPDYVIKGSLKDAKGQPITNVKVQANDSDQQWFEDRNDDFLGNVWVKSDGTFEIPFDSKQFQEGWLEGNPDIYLLIRNSSGEIVHQTEIRIGVKPSDTRNLTFDIVLDSLEKRIEPSADPYAQNNARVLAAFARLGDVFDIRVSDTERVLKLLTSAVNAWSLYTREEMWKVIKYDGPQVPRYPWKEPKHSHKLGWDRQ